MKTEDMTGHAHSLRDDNEVHDLDSASAEIDAGDDPPDYDDDISEADRAAVVALATGTQMRPLSELSDDELEERIRRAEDELALMGDREGILAVQLRALDYLLEHPQSSLPPLWSAGVQALDEPNLRALIEKFAARHE